MHTTSYNLGPLVICDGPCNKDYTHDATSLGGLLFGSKAYCPACAPALEESARRHGETQYIRDRARDGETFRDFVYRLRGHRDAISKVTSFSSTDELLNHLFGVHP